MTTFRKATKAQARARIALIGPSGSGKTLTALKIARGLGSRIAVIDTERGSASKYAGLDGLDFDVLELDQHHPQQYIDAIRAAVAERYEVVIIDSLSHAWMGRGGALELVDNAAKRSKTANSFAAWRDVTPLHNALVDAIIAAPLHVIATMRAKTEYVLEQGPNGKTAPRKVGLAPIQRDGLEYEFDVVADLDLDHTLIVGKTRCADLDGAVIPLPDEKLGRTLGAWLSDGQPPADRLVAQPAEAATTQAPATTKPADAPPPSPKQPPQDRGAAVEHWKPLIEQAAAEHDLAALHTLWTRIPAETPNMYHRAGAAALAATAFATEVAARAAEGLTEAQQRWAIGKLAEMGVVLVDRAWPSKQRPALKAAADLASRTHDALEAATVREPAEVA